MSSSSSPWVSGAIGFGAGLLANWLMNCDSSSCGANKQAAAEEKHVEKKGQSVELPLPLRDTRKNPALEIDILSQKQHLDHVDFSNKRVLMRVDYNVKIKKGEVVDATRITSTIPTLQAILNKKSAKGGVKCIVLITHLGRPAGNFLVKEYTVEPICKVLQHHLPGTEVKFLSNCIGDEIVQATKDCKPGTVFLCENLRFHPEEAGVKVVTKADGTVEKIKSTFAEKVAFRQKLSQLGDVFVFEAFGAAHRPHSSIIGIDLPQRVAGLLMQREMNYYSQVLGSPKRPFLAIIGGSKVSDKILVLENMVNLVDEMIIGGGMAYTFLKIMHNMKIGNSLFDSEGAGLVYKILEKAKERGVKLHFPVDHIIGDKFSADAKIGVTDNVLGVPEGWMALDVGPQSRAAFSLVMARAHTILWNGPLGVYELAPFGSGTISAMWDMVAATKRGATTIIGGGDTGSASKFFYIGNKPVADCVSHVSTGGGSSLVLMEGKLLPAVGALSNIGDNSRPPPPDEKNEPEDDGDD